MREPPASDFHQQSADAVVFDDRHSAGHRRIRIVSAVILLAASVILPQFGLAGFTKSGVPVDLGLLGAGVAMVIWETHAYFISGAAPGKSGFIIIDKEGIGGDALKSRMERIEWRRLQSLETDERAVVVTFSSRDIASKRPIDRISQMRLVSPNAPPAEIIEAIHRFWTPPGDASHSG